MSRSTTTTQRVVAHRQRRKAAGLLTVTSDVPRELVAEIDLIRDQRGLAGRGPIIEEALRFYIENALRA